MAGGVSNDDRRGTTEAEVIREQVRAARQRRGGGRGRRDEQTGTVLGALVRMLDTPPVTDEPDPNR